MSLPAITTKFNIVLDRPNQYYPGDTLLGSVSLHSQRPEGQHVNVGSISITFSGRTATSKHVRDIQSHRRSLQLFVYRSRLYDGPGLLYAPPRSSGQGRSLSFPFSFTFPSNCRVSQNENFQGGPFFNSDPSQPLPPSFTDVDSLDEASVVYELSAELLAPGFKGYYMEGSFLQRQPLNLYIQRNAQEPTIQYSLHSNSFIHQSLDLFPAAEREFHKRPMTISQKLGIKPPSTERYPKAAFQATVLMPSVAVIDQPLSLMLHIDHDSKQSTVATPPIIHLKRVQVWLRVETSICGMTHKDLRLDLAKDRDQTGWRAITMLAQNDFDKEMPRVEHLDLRKVMDLKIDSSLIPTFKTFNVARTYSLKVGARIECAGKDFHVWGFDYVKCILQAKDFSPGLPDYTMPPPSVGGEEDMIDDPPPPYEQVAETRRLGVAPTEPSVSRRARRRHERSIFSSSDAAASSRGGSGGGGGAGGE